MKLVFDCICFAVSNRRIVYTHSQIQTHTHMKPLLLGTLLFCTLGASSQDFLKRIKNKVATNAETKAGDRLSEVVTEPLDKKGGSSTPSSATSENKNEPNANAGEEKELTAFSKYDFIPGERILYAHDFAGEAIGELPMGWNTDGTGMPTSKGWEVEVEAIAS